MASALKVKLARKLSSVINEEVNPEDIHFTRNGCRNDVVRWIWADLQCFSGGAYCVQDDVELKISETVQYGCREVYASKVFACTSS